MGDSATSQEDGFIAEPPDARDPITVPDEVFELRSPPPVRALAIASAAAVAGAVVIALSHHIALTVIGAVLLALGVLLAVLAIVLVTRLRSAVRLNEAGLEVSRGSRRGFLAWAEINQVHESGHQLIALAKDDQRDLMITVPGPRGSAYVRLLKAITQRLDNSRGYRK